MPPKRKISATTVSLDPITPRRVKIARKKTAAVQARCGMTSKTWFEKYADSDNREMMSPEGCQAFYAEIKVSLESITPIVIGYKMKCSRMGYITLEEWIDTMGTNVVDGTEKFRLLVDSWEKAVLKSPEEFKELYLFAFKYAKSETQKSMDVETAVALWQVMLENKYPLAKSFIQFILETKPVKVINKDQWNNLLDFCKAMPEDLSTYDSMSFWPVLFDDYVEWKKSL